MKPKLDLPRLTRLRPAGRAPAGSLSTAGPRACAVVVLELRLMSQGVDPNDKRRTLYIYIYIQTPLAKG